VPPARPSPPAIAAAATALGFAAVTALVTSWSGVDAFDARFAPPRIEPASAWGQILQSAAISTAPVTNQIIVVIGLAVWAWNHRLRRLAVAMLSAYTVTMALTELVKHTVLRPRPDSPFAGTLVQGGYAFPSGHVSGAVIVALMAVTILVKQRGSGARLWLAHAVAVLAVAGVALDRWAMGAHSVTDLAGGALLGLAVGYTALALGNPLSPGLARGPAPALEPPPPAALAVAEPALPAVVYNPAKFTDLSLFRRRLDFELRRHGWGEPVWLETTVAETGMSQTRQALDQGAGLVVAAGGDGTIRAVCEGLLGSAVPMTLVPSGTGNLLAHNLGIPLDQDAAFAIGLGGTPTPLDLIRVRSDGFEGLCTVMGGMGIDAAAMAGTRPDLKKLVGNVAYAVSILQQFRGEPFDVLVTLDDHEPVARVALMAMFGNVGGTQTPFLLFPAAKYDDGLLDLLVSAAIRPRDWAVMATEIIAGSVPATPARKEARPAPPQDLPPPSGGPEPLEYAQARQVRFDASRPVPFEVDGDAIAEVTWLEAECLPAAVRVMTRA
jgi:diacylglycerol kinase family enzyme/membrane-associated phospholipid phosphatase